MKRPFLALRSGDFANDFLDFLLMYNTPLTTRNERSLENFGKALANMNDALALMAERPLSKLERLGLLKSFELVHELALQNSLVPKDGTWQKMTDDRMLLNDDYDEEIADFVAERIVGHAKSLNAFAETMELK